MESKMSLLSAASNLSFTKSYNLYPDQVEHIGEYFDGEPRIAPSESVTTISESITGETGTSSTSSLIGGGLETGSAIFRNKYGITLQHVPLDVLTKEMIQFGISITGPILTTQLIQRVAYTKLEVCNRNLRDISLITKYPYLRFVDFSDNHILDLEPLTALKYLQVLNIEGNKINSVTNIPTLPWLQAINLTRNEISSLNGFQSTQLCYLRLSHNGLTTAEYLTAENFPNLLLLELRDNFLTSIQDLDLPKLKHLYIANNHLTDLDGIQNCPSLVLIHARQNKISSLNGFPNLEKLLYVNLRCNDISKFTEIIPLGNSPNIETVILSQNKLEKRGRYRSEICGIVLNIKRIDKMIVGEAELVQGRLLRSGRVKGLIESLEYEENALAAAEAEEEGEGDEIAGEGFVPNTATAARAADE